MKAAITNSSNNLSLKAMMYFASINKLTLVPVACAATKSADAGLI